jgi:hypothetical protein
MSDKASQESVLGNPRFRFMKYNRIGADAVTKSEIDVTGTTASYIKCIEWAELQR